MTTVSELGIGVGEDVETGSSEEVEESNEALVVCVTVTTAVLVEAVVVETVTTDVLVETVTTDVLVEAITVENVATVVLVAVLNCVGEVEMLGAQVLQQYHDTTYSWSV